jgi:hypothetical protein
LCSIAQGSHTTVLALSCITFFSVTDTEAK